MAELADTQPLQTSFLQLRWSEVDKLNIVTKFPCLLGLPVCTEQGRRESILKKVINETTKTIVAGGVTATILNVFSDKEYNRYRVKHFLFARICKL